MGKPTEESSARWRSNRSDKSGTEPPENQDPHKNPPGSPAHHADRAGDFQNNVAPEKDSSAEANDCWVKSQTAYPQWFGSPRQEASNPQKRPEAGRRGHKT